MPQPLLVSIGVITNQAGEVLIAKRPAGLEQGGLWELPGGKLAPYETGLQALKREIAEEVGLEVLAARPLIRVSHDYPEKKVILDVWKVLEFSGTPKGLEGQPLRWVSQANLANYQFPKANLHVFAVLNLEEVLSLSAVTYLEAKDLQQLNSANPAAEKGLPLVIGCSSLTEVKLAEDYNPSCLALNLRLANAEFDWQEFSYITQQTNLPCYALGEFDASYLTRVFGLGGQGIAIFDSQTQQA